MKCVVVHLGFKNKKGDWIEKPVDKIKKTAMLINDFDFMNDDKKLAYALRGAVLALESEEEKEKQNKTIDLVPQEIKHKRSV